MKKIMFNDKYGLTEAVIEGRKTMTRRIVKEKYLRIYEDMSRLGQPCHSLEEWLIRKAAAYKVGEVVAVAQSGKEIYNQLQQRYGNTSDAALGFMEMYKGLAMWRNKMFVPADLCLNKICITDIKVERLQDISDEDCIKDGTIIDTHRGVLDDNIYMFEVEGKHYCQWHFPNPREAFAALIERPGIGHKGDWSKNPWVFAYTFELVE